LVGDDDIAIRFYNLLDINFLFRVFRFSSFDLKVF